MKFIKKLLSFLFTLIFIGACALAALYYTDLLPAEITEIFVEEDPTLTQVKKRLNASSVYPFYNSLSESEKEAYAKICAAIEKSDTDYFSIGYFNKNDVSEDGTRTYQQILTGLLYEQPQYFWLNLNEYLIQTNSLHPTKNNVSLKLSYSLSGQQLQNAKEKFNERKNKFISLAREKETTYDKVLFVHNTIIKICEYDYSIVDSSQTGVSFLSNSDLSRSAYGCLVDGKTVCSGYTQTFTLIMQELGFECGTEINKAEDHIWNYCNLDGDYYYFDLTWDDPSFESDDDEAGIEHQISYNYFGLTKSELALTHDLDENAETPECKGTKYNYYAYNGLYVPVYDFYEVEDVISKQLYENGSYAEIRFKNAEETAKAKQDLIENQRIFEITDTSSISYMFSKSDLHLYVYCE